MRDDTAEDFGPAIFEPVDFILQRTRRDFRGNVELFEPFFHFGEDAGIGRHGEDGGDPVDGQELDGAVVFAAGEGVGFEDLFQLFGDIGGPSVLHFVGAHALAGEGVAVEHGHQFQGAPHVAAVVENDQQIGGVVAGDLAAVTDKRREHFGHFGGSGVFEEDQVQDHVLVFRQL